MKIIDFRCRPPFGPFLKDWIFQIEDVPGNPGLGAKYKKMGMDLLKSLLNASMPDFFAECSACGIDYSVAPVRLSPELGNGAVADLPASFPGKFAGFAGIQPLEMDIPECMEEIEKYVINGPCAGVYMEPGLDPEPWAIDIADMFNIYELCARHNQPVCFLYGGVFHKKNPSSYTYYDPARVERVAKAFPALRIALSHACWPFAAHACAIALNHENVWLSPDGFMINHPASQDYVVAANYRLQDKIIFGSLYPSTPLKYAVAQYKNLLRPEVWQKVFCDNARDYLKL